jgi:hypothetical protein
LLIASSVWSQTEKEFRHAINTCPFGLAFGIASVNYEYMAVPGHSFVLRGDYEAIPQTYSRAEIEASGIAVIANYRWHPQQAMDSWFLGVYVRYRVYEGDGTETDTDFEFALSEYTGGTNAGYRWIWGSGFTATFSLGYGLSIDSRSVDIAGGGRPDAPIDAAIDAFAEDYSFASPFLGELSIGYAF